MLFAGWEVRIMKNHDQSLENFQAWGHSFSLYGPTLSWQITCLFFFPGVNWLYRLQMSLFTQLLSLNLLARCLLTISKKSWQRASNSDSRQRKMYWRTAFFKNYFMLVTYISPVKFFKIVFVVWHCVQSLKFYHKNNFC